jgi:hypothetical protein
VLILEVRAETMDVEASRGSFQEQLLETYGLVRMNSSKSHTGSVRVWHVSCTCFAFHVFLVAVASDE